MIQMMVSLEQTDQGPQQLDFFTPQKHQKLQSSTLASGPPHLLLDLLPDLLRIVPVPSTAITANSAIVATVVWANEAMFLGSGRGGGANFSLERAKASRRNCRNWRWGERTASQQAIQPIVGASFFGSAATDSPHSSHIRIAGVEICGAQLDFNNATGPEAVKDPPLQLVP